MACAILAHEVIYVEKIRGLIVAAAVGLLLSGCVGGLGGSGTDVGTLKVSITDAPEHGMETAKIEVTGVTIKPQGGQWTRVSDFSEEPVPIDLLSLRFDEKVLFEEHVEQGYYNQLRIETKGNGTITFNDERDDAEIHIPSDGFKVIDDANEGPIYVGEGENWILLDVNVARFVERGNNGDTYNITPNAIRVLDRAEVAVVKGRVLDADEDEEPWDKDILLGLVPSAENNAGAEKVKPEDALVLTYALREEQDTSGRDPGDFQFNGVPDGEYSLHAWVAEENENENENGGWVQLDLDAEVDLESIKLDGQYTMDDPYNLGEITATLNSSD